MRQRQRRMHKVHGEGGTPRPNLRIYPRVRRQAEGPRAALPNRPRVRIMPIRTPAPADHSADRPA
jgi:hypothetical protein